MAMATPRSTASAVVTPITPPYDADGVPPAREKRKRAGKPKVRTGCVTWRIKCDEEKPACQRCILTGRTCDGYKTTAKPKATRRPGITHQLTSTTPSSSTSMTLLMPLVTDFTGDVIERHYIHRFLPIAEDVVGIQHVHNSFFWGHVVPEYCFASEAVKHATIALSSAYHNFQLLGFRPDASNPPSTTEFYTIKQYNLSLNKLAEEINCMPVRRRYGIIMICCVSFFYIEIMRNQWSTALMHFINGLRLMADLPDELEEIFKYPEKFKGNDNLNARGVYMLGLLRRWETSAGFLAANLKPTLSLQAYESRKRLCSTPSDFRSLEQLQDILNDLCQDVNAFIWLCKQYNGDDSWDHSATKLQHDILQQRSFNIAGLIEKGRGAYDDMERTAKASEYLAFQACLLRHRGAALALDQLPLRRRTPYSPPLEELGRFEEIIAIANTIKTALRKALSPGASPWFNVDFGVVSILYITAVYCQDEAMSARLFDELRQWPWRENLWDGPLLREQLHKKTDVKVEEVDMPAEATLAYRPLSG